MSYEASCVRVRGVRAKTNREHVTAPEVAPYAGSRPTRDEGWRQLQFIGKSAFRRQSRPPPAFGLARPRKLWPGAGLLLAVQSQSSGGLDFIPAPP